MSLKRFYKENVQNKRWTCPKCGAEQAYTLPYLRDGMAGWVTPLHGACEFMQSSISTPVSAEKKSFYSKVLG